MAEVRLSNWSTSQKQAVLNTILPHRPLGVKRDFNARGDARVAIDAAVTAGNATITSATAAFTQSDVGKTIGIAYAGAGPTVGETHVSTILTVGSATTCTLASAPVKSIVGPRTVTDAAMTYNSQNLTSATANFTSGDVGKLVTVPGAGLLLAVTGENPLTAKIVSVTNSTTAVLAVRAQATVTGKTVAIPGAWACLGTDDTEALQAAFNAGAASRTPIELEPGRYLTTAELGVSSNLHVFGHGPGLSVLNLVATNGAAIGGQAAMPGYSDITIRDFEIDGSGARGSSYGTTRKALYIRPCTRLRITGMYCHDTSATAIGCDFLPFGQITNNVVIRGGTQVPEFGGGGGGSGIGVGTGRWTHEPLTISGNHVEQCGNNGIFVESQSSNVMSRGIRITDNYSAWNGGNGIGDNATEGTITANNIAEYNGKAGIAVSFGFAAGLHSTESRVHGNVVRSNGEAGIMLWVKTGSFVVENNTILGTISTAYAGIYLTSSVTGATVKDVIIRGNKIEAHPQVTGAINNGRGIYHFAGSVRTLVIESNHISDCGRAGTPHFPAIDVKGDVARALYVRQNIAFDSRTTKLQSYGLTVSAGTTAKLVMSGNDFTGNELGEYDLTGGTVTAQVIGANP